MFAATRGPLRASLKNQLLFAVRNINREGMNRPNHRAYLQQHEETTEFVW